MHSMSQHVRQTLVIEAECNAKCGMCEWNCSTLPIPCCSGMCEYVWITLQDLASYICALQLFFMYLFLTCSSLTSPSLLMQVLLSLTPMRTTMLHLRSCVKWAWAVRGKKVGGGRRAVSCGCQLISQRALFELAVQALASLFSGHRQ